MFLVACYDPYCCCCCHFSFLFLCLYCAHLTDAIDCESKTNFLPIYLAVSLRERYLPFYIYAKLKSPLQSSLTCEITHIWHVLHNQSTNQAMFYFCVCSHRGDVRQRKGKKQQQQQQQQTNKTHTHTTTTTTTTSKTKQNKQNKKPTTQNVKYVCKNILSVKHILLECPITTELFQKKMDMTLMLATYYTYMQHVSISCSSITNETAV